MGGFLSPVLSLGGALFGGDSAPSAPAVNVYQPTGTGQQDANLQGLLTSNTNALSGQNNPFTQLTPQILQAFQQLYSTPGAAQYTAGAGNAGTAYTGIGNQSVGTSSALNTAALAALPGATQVMNLGLDPQTALYNQQLQQTNDLANVTNAQYGLTGQQAAGAVNQADTNFNIDWQNQQLQRALAGLSGYNQTLNSVGTAGTAAQNVGAAGAGSILAGGAAPYTAGQTVGGNQETALAQYISQLLGPVTSSQATIGDLAGYLGQGINASSAGQSASLADYYAQLQGAAGGAIGGASLGNSLSGLSGLSSLFSTQAAPATSGLQGLGDIANSADLADLAYLADFA